MKSLSESAVGNAGVYKDIKQPDRKLKKENPFRITQNMDNLHFKEIIGSSTGMNRILTQIKQVAMCDATVLILGETGVGKELVARAIYHMSRRRDKQFIPVNCNILQENLIQSELFGHEKGAFTGAVQRRIGRFELANGGTLFLDEIGDFSPETQAALLRTLETKRFERIGGNETISSDYRLLAATNCYLERAVKENRFRADLYYRLNVFPIHVPPLRHRKEDIPLLAHYFLRMYGKKMGKTFHMIPNSEIKKLIQFDWPGNVRELENIIARGVILSSSNYFRVPELDTHCHDSIHSDTDLTLKENERRHIFSTLRRTGWKVRGPGGAAELLDIHPSTLMSRMQKLGIQRPKDLHKRRTTSRAIPLGTY